VQFSQFDTDWVLDGVFRAGSQCPKTWPDESGRVALASATRFCGAELRSPKSRKTPAPVPDADALPAFGMHGINKKGLPAKTGKPFLFIQWWRRRESNPRPQALYRQFYILSTII